MEKPSKKLSIVWAALVLSLPVVVWAANLTIPNTFTTGSSVSSSQMNANFAAVATAVNTKQDVTTMSCSGGQALTAIANGSATCGAVGTSYAAGTGLALNGTTFSLANANGCANGVVGQTWNASHMVGCDCTGSGCVTPVRDAERLCAPGWHVCTLSEWNTYRSTALSNANRYITAIIGSCSGCNSDVLQTTPAVDVCAPNLTTCNNAAFPYFVGPSEIDYACVGWPTGVNNGNVARIAAYTNSTVTGVPPTAKATCLADPGSSTGGVAGAISVGGTMCCQ